MKISDIVAKRLENEPPGSTVIYSADIRIILLELEHCETVMRSDTQRIERLLNACRIAITTNNLKPIQDILEQEDAWGQSIS